MRRSAFPWRQPHTISGRSIVLLFFRCRAENWKHSFNFAISRLHLTTQVAFSNERRFPSVVCLFVRTRVVWKRDDWVSVCVWKIVQNGYVLVMTRQTKTMRHDLASHVFSPLRYYLADNDGQHMDIIFILSKESNNLRHCIITGTWGKSHHCRLALYSCPHANKNKNDRQQRRRRQKNCLMIPPLHLERVSP